MEIKQTKGGKKEFQIVAKEYVINMTGNIRTLHRKNGCSHSDCFFEYCDFDTEEMAEKSGISYSKCSDCFKKY